MPLPAAGIYHNKVPKIHWGPRAKFEQEPFFVGYGYAAPGQQYYDITALIANGTWVEAPTNAATGVTFGGSGMIGSNGYDGMGFVADHWGPGRWYLTRTYAGYPPGSLVTGRIWCTIWAAIGISFRPYARINDGEPGYKAAFADLSPVTIPHGFVKEDGTFTVTISGGVFNYPSVTWSYWDHLEILVHNEIFDRPNPLDFGYPLMNARSYPELRAGSQTMEYDSGIEDGWVEFDSVLEGTVLTVPPSRQQTDWAPVSGFNEPGGWREFLEYGRDGGKFTFFPDREDETTYFDAFLEDPKTGDLVGRWMHTRQIPLRIVRADGEPIVGY